MKALPLSRSRSVPARAPVRAGTSSRLLTGLVPLVHTVSRPQSQYAPLMRTVLRDTNHRFTGGLVRSPVLLSRASGRSLGLQNQVVKRVSSVIYMPRVSARAFACARRQIRREVILAMGKGGGRHRPPSYRSNWRC